MSTPAIPKIAPELWVATLSQLTALRKAEPWRWTPDSAVSTYVDAAGDPWFACILGNGGQLLGLCLYRGIAGLRFHRRVRELGPAFDPDEYQHEQDAITVWFGPKSDLLREQRALYESLGFAPKRNERLAWPDVRSHRPGYFPWLPDESELRVLLDAIPGILCFAEIFRRHPDCYAAHGPWELPTVPAAGSAPTLGSLEWRTWLNPPPPEIAPPVPIDHAAPLFRQVAALPQADEAIEVDWFYMPQPVAEGGRPFYPRCLATFRHNGGFCFGMDLLNNEDDAAVHAAPMILDAIERLGARPTQILTRKPDLAARLQLLASSVGAQSIIVPRLSSVDDFRNGFLARMG